MLQVQPSIDELSSSSSTPTPSAASLDDASLNNNNNGAMTTPTSASKSKGTSQPQVLGAAPTGNSKLPGDAQSDASVSIPLSVVFTVQLLLIVAGFSGVTVMFVVTHKSQITSNVVTIASKSLEVNANYIVMPLTLNLRSTTITAHVMASDPSTLQISSPLQNVSDVATFGKEFALFRSVVLDNAFVAYVYEDYDTGLPSSLVDGSSSSGWFSAITEVAAFSGGCSTTDVAGAMQYITVPDDTPNDPQQFNFTVTDVFNDTLVSNLSYAIAAMSSNMTHDVWTSPYFYQEAALTSILLSHFHCLEPNVTSGGCRHTIGQDVNLGYLATLLGGLGSTPSSVVSLVDLVAMTMVITSDAVAALDGSGSMWQATETPSAATNEAVRRFVAACPGLVACAPMVQQDSVNIYAGLHIAPFNGVSMLMVDISPRSFYYGAADDALQVAIAVVVCVTVSAAAVCVLTLIGIALPVRSLIAAFTLAADLRNEEVVATRSVLAEVQALSRAFHTMNAKLLAARAFMPQSMLAGNPTDDAAAEDDDDEGDVMIASDSVSSASFSKSTSSKSSTALSGQTGSSGGLGRSSTGGALVDRKVSILVVNIVGLHRAFEERRGASVERDYARWLEGLQAAVRSEKGVIEAFHGDRLVVTFNASNVVHAHGRRAAQCALSIAEGAMQTAFPVLSMGVASGRSLTGPLGSASLRAFVTLGPVCTDAAALERLAKTLAVRDAASVVLLTQGVADEASTTVRSYLAGRCASARGRLYVAAGLVEKRAVEDEWLYEMEESTKEDPFIVVSTAVQALLEGRYELAESIAQLHGDEAHFVKDDALRRAWCHVKRLLREDEALRSQNTNIAIADGGMLVSPTNTNGMSRGRSMSSTVYSGLGVSSLSIGFLGRRGSVVEGSGVPPSHAAGHRQRINSTTAMPPWCPPAAAVPIMTPPAA